MPHDTITAVYASFFERELSSFINELRGVPDEKLWTVPDGVSNSAGVLAQHIAGNLNHFFGHVLGQSDYVRQRDREFTDTGRSREELVADLERGRRVVAEVLPTLDEETLAAPFPVRTPFELTTFGMLVQLHYHLSYHLGQLNYLRRLMGAA